MEIITQGKGTDFFTPDQIILNINFNLKGKTYEEVLFEGTKTINDFVNELLLKKGFNKEDMKTRNFVIREETKYNEITRNYEPDGYSFSQNAILKFDYDKERLANMIEDISKLSNPPMSRINFGVKDEKDCRRKILAKAYKDAEEQAKAIAKAAGVTLSRCVKVDFKPFTEMYISNTSFDGDMMYRSEKTSFSAASAITNTFTPEDIELTETLYCLWLAE